MKKFLPDGKCERWDETWTHVYWYDDECVGCKHVVQIGKRKFCGKIEGGRVSLHQVVRSQIGCTFCPNATKKLDCKACLQCLERHTDVQPFDMMSTIMFEHKHLTCNDCMIASPYYWCCRLECGQHESCRDCKSEIRYKNPLCG